MTDIRKMVLAVLQPRNYTAYSILYHVRAVERFAMHFGKPPDQLNWEHLREYEDFLVHERRLRISTIRSQIFVLRSFLARSRASGCSPADR
jgi:hypothetical protein